MTVSCMAEANATARARTAVAPRSPTGLVEPSPARVTISSSWAPSAQPRLRPNRLLNIGSGRRSTNGAKMNFSEYGEAYQREQADLGFAEAGFGEPGGQRLGQSAERQAAGEAEGQHRQDPPVLVDGERLEPRAPARPARGRAGGWCGGGNG